MKRTVLIVDDDVLWRDLLRSQLEGQHLAVRVAGTASEALAACAASRIDVVLLDQRLPDGLGAELCPAILAANDRAKIIFMTAFPSVENAVRAVRAGAYDYLTKPFAIEELQLALQRALRLQYLEGIEQVHRRQARQDCERTDLAGVAGGLAGIFELARLAAESTAPCLITGETGTGKTVLARFLHCHSTRCTGPFVAINTASLPETLAESELFGHERGAFTSAVAMRRGCFELADGGTLLLDEVGAMSASLQAKLLSAVEEGRVRRLGAETSRRVNVRILAATNAKLEDEVAEHRFRQDLLYRLSVLRIDIPPLRERREDIPELCSMILRRFGRETELAAEEMRNLQAYDWPGNVRELQNVLERAVILQREGPLRPSLFVRAAERPPESPAEDAALCSLGALEEEHIRKVLAACEGNQTRAARILGVALSTLKRKIARRDVIPA